MSWKVINHILGLASINPTFQRQLQEDPLAALDARDFELTSQELEVFKASASLPFSQFCQCLLEALVPDEDCSSGDS